MAETKPNSYEKEIIRMLESIETNGVETSRDILLRHDDNFLGSGSLRRALNFSLERKKEKIEKFLQNKSPAELRQHKSQLYGFACSSYGLIGDDYREKIWPILAETIPRVEKLSRSGSSRKRKSDCDDGEETARTSENNSDSDFESALSEFSLEEELNKLNDDEFDNGIELPEPSMADLRTHKEWNQVELDVNRTLARFPPNISDTERDSLQKDLTPLIVRVLWENPNFSYYQGFHDVCLTLVLAMNVRKALYVAKLLTKRSAFYNYLTTSLEASAMNELNLLYVLLYLGDDEVERRLRDVELGTLFALSWPITWFSHDLRDYSQIVVFFDLFLSSHPLMPVYVGAALIIARRKELLECPPEMPYLHKLLGTMPDHLDVNRVLDSARHLFATYPPPLIRGEYRREYEKMCVRVRKRQAAVAKLLSRSASSAKGLHCHGSSMRNAPLIQRYNALNTPTSAWIAVGTLAVAVYFWLSKTSMAYG